MKLENTVHDIAIDFHDVPFYGRVLDLLT